MSTMMDITFSMFVAGALLILILNANFTVQQAWAFYNSEAIVERTLVELSQILESDLRNMGAGLSENTNAILEATKSSISFQYIRDGENFARTIRYYCGNPSELSFTDNPYDFYLYRQENNGVPYPIGIVTKFELRYLANIVQQDNSGNTIFEGVDYLDENNPPLSMIRMVEVTLEVQNPYSLISMTEENINDPSKRYAHGIWKQTRLASHNLQR
ncbi:MAG: hypothetical protein N3A63_10240 [Bacteroidetes bacterium]|nr:hypothetical protein [Bacteroidota bacterium]